MSGLSIIGGSIAGYLSALAFRNTGFEVSVFERSTASLADRGAAVVIPQELFSRLKDLHFFDADMPHWWQTMASGREWFMDETRKATDS